MKYVTNDLIHRVLVEKSANYLNAIPKVLWNDVEKAYVEFINNFLYEYNAMPPLEVFKEHFVDFRHSSVSSEVPAKYIFDVISKNLSEKYVNSHINDPHPDKTQREWLEELLRLSKINDINVMDYVNDDRLDYEKKITSLPFYLPWFDETFDGLFPGEVTFLLGRPKSFKTTILQYMMITMLNNGHNVLSISQEITNEKMRGKLDAFQTNIQPKKFRSNKFEGGDKERIKAKVNEMRQSKGRLILGGKVGSLNDLKALYYNADKRPEIIFIDAVELLGGFNPNKEAHQSLLEVAYNLQSLALDLKIPIVGTLQANRQAAKSSEMDTTHVAGSDGFARACEALIGVSANVEPDGKIVITLQTIAFRDGELKKIYMIPDFKKMKMSFHQLADVESFATTEAALENVQTLEEFNEAKHRVVENPENVV